jgi:uncharacterized Zn finger protein (UPF0148 family)
MTAQDIANLLGIRCDECREIKTEFINTTGRILCDECYFRLEAESEAAPKTAMPREASEAVKSACAAVLQKGGRK